TSALGPLKEASSCSSTRALTSGPSTHPAEDRGENCRQDRQFQDGLASDCTDEEQRDGQTTRPPCEEGCVLSAKRTVPPAIRALAGEPRQTERQVVHLNRVPVPQPIDSTRRSAAPQRQFLGRGTRADRVAGPAQVEECSI